MYFLQNKFITTRFHIQNEGYNFWGTNMLIINFSD